MKYTEQEKKEFLNDVADLFVMLEGFTEELRSLGGGDDRTLKIIKGSLDLQESFKSKMKIGSCKHENEKMHQTGDGFVYVTCADCGKDL